MNLHAKIKAAAIACLIILLGLVPAVVSGTTSLHSALVAAVAAIVPVVVGYLKSSA
jgi:hypothetical protein